MNLRKMRRECRHDWIPLVHPVGRGQELLGIDCERCGAYYGQRSPFNKHANAQHLGNLYRSPDYLKAADYGYVVGESEEFNRAALAAALEAAEGRGVLMPDGRVKLA